MRATASSSCFGGLVLVLLLLRPGVSLGGTIYTLTGDPYNNCSGTYVVSGACGPYALSGWFQLADGFNVDNLTPTAGQGEIFSADYPDGNLDGHILAFSFSDGSLTINSTEAGGHGTFNVATDASGNVIWWMINVCVGSCSTGLGGSFEGSYWFPSYPQTYEVSATPSGLGSCFAYGVASPVGNCGGSWSPPVSTDSGTPAVPEPSSLALLGLGLVALGAALRRHGG